MGRGSRENRGWLPWTGRERPRRPQHHLGARDGSGARSVSFPHGGNRGPRASRPGCHRPRFGSPRPRSPRPGGPAPRSPPLNPRPRRPRPQAPNWPRAARARDRWSADAVPCSLLRARSRPTMGNSAGRSDFEWVYTDQPHTQRRKEMLGERRPGPLGTPYPCSGAVGAAPLRRRPRPAYPRVPPPGLCLRVGTRDAGTGAPGSTSQLLRPGGDPGADPGADLGPPDAGRGGAGVGHRDQLRGMRCPGPGTLPSLPRPPRGRRVDRMGAPRWKQMLNQRFSCFKNQSLYRGSRPEDPVLDLVAERAVAAPLSSRVPPGHCYPHAAPSSGPGIEG